MKQNIFTTAVLFICLLSGSLLYNSCQQDEESDDTIRLQSWGPSPALRGGELKFIGFNLDKVTAIVLPDNIEVTTFKTKTSELVIIDVPESTMPGEIVIKTPQGDIYPKTYLGISEPIVLDTIVPVNARPGDTVSINGDYLNLIKEVIFSSKKTVTAFVSQSKSQIRVKVPDDAQTGTVSVSNGETEPIVVESTFPFNVALPTISSFAPKPVKAGAELTITGTNLDLTNKIIFGGDKIVTVFSKEKTSIKVNVPADAQDGVIKLVPVSLMEVKSVDTLKMVVPTISSISPNPAKNNGTLTIAGTDLDLIKTATFGGNKNVDVKDAGTSTQITIKVPADATEDFVTFKTAANKSVNSAAKLTLVKPTITAISPASTAAHQDITITGTDLDLVSKIIFGGGWEAKVKSGDASQIIVTVTPGSTSGTVKLVTTNGSEVVSTDALTVVPNVPVIATIPNVGVGELLTITGTNMDVFADIIFPGNIKATMFGQKTPTMIQVYVPLNATKGTGILKFITRDNEVLEKSIYILEDIAKYIYKEGLETGWDQWGGWGVTSQDWNNTENPKAGTKAIKVVYAGNWGAIQAHPKAADAFKGYNNVKLSIYGGTGSEGKSLQLYIKDAAGTSHPSFTLTLNEGKWTTYTIPLSSLGNPPSVAEFVIQDKGANCTVYIDEVGLM